MSATYSTLHTGIPQVPYSLDMCPTWHPNCGCQIGRKSCSSMKERIGPPSPCPGDALLSIPKLPYGGLSRTWLVWSHSGGSDGFYAVEWPTQ